MVGTFSADVLGGDGSLCPALLPNPSLRRIHAGVLTEWFENGDCLLVFKGPHNDTNDSNNTKQELAMLRILLTDSGHYLLPMDNESDNGEKTNNNIERFMLHMQQPMNNHNNNGQTSLQPFTFMLTLNMTEQPQWSLSRVNHPTNFMTITKITGSWTTRTANSSESISDHDLHCLCHKKITVLLYLSVASHHPEQQCRCSKAARRKN